MTIMSHLSTLESAGLIRLAQLEPDLEYLFRHVLVQDAAYASLLESDQRRLHHAVGRAVEKLYPDRLDEYAPMLARHFAQAEDDQRTLEYSIRAGDTALAAYANVEAGDQYRRALALNCSESQRAILLSGLGEALYRQSRLQEAIKVWREGIEVCQGLGDSDRVALLYARSARAVWHSGDVPAGLRLCQEGMEAVADAPESPDLALLLHETGRAYFFNHEPDRARALCTEALGMAERLGAANVQADALATLGVLPDQSPDEAIATLTQAVELAESSGLLEVAHRAHHNLAAMSDELLGDLEASRQHFLQAAGVARKRGVATEELSSLGAVASTSLSLGDLATARALVPEIEHLIGTLPSEERAGYTQVAEIQITLQVAEGKWAEALRQCRRLYAEARHEEKSKGSTKAAASLAEYLLEGVRLGIFHDDEERAAALAEAEEALQDVKDKKKGSTRSWLLAHLSMVYAHQGRLAEARHHLDQARPSGEAKGKPWNKLVSTLAEAEIAVAAGSWTEALAAYETAVGLAARRELRWLWARALQDWAEVHIARGEPADYERAQALLREARALFEEMGATYFIDWTEDRLKMVRARTFDQALALGKVAQELAVAGRIQEGLLPAETPYLPGWQIAATLEPARETSGDYYDFIPLPGGQWGLVIADVADKGAGAALYMALSRTVLRNYTTQYPHQPELALGEANRRILSDTRTDMFVTVFYGILDPVSGTLTYCNAGHNPPFLLNRQGVQKLERTGMALGVVEDAAWDRGVVEIRPGDALLLYTDGVIDALNPEGTMFGERGLLEAAEAEGSPSAHEIEAALLAELHRFVAQAPQFDDITLMVVVRT